MLSANEFLEGLARRGFGLFSGVPCSYLTPLMDQVQAASQWRYVAAANEGDAVAIAAGSELAGVRSAILMQNSGLGNAVNPLTSLTHTFSIPILVMVSLRGDPQGEPDAHQHRLMGRITTDLLELMEIPWEYLPTDQAQVDEVLSRAVSHMTEHKKPYALVVRKKTFSGGCEVPPPPARTLQAQTIIDIPSAQFTRQRFLEVLVKATVSLDVLLASTGYTGRELSDCMDRENHLYMAGSMGCCCSLGLGLALSKPERRVIVLDGDAALAMRMGALTTIGREAPENFVHLVFDNGVNESTGGQCSPAAGGDFRATALSCGYRRATTLAEPEQLVGALDGPGPALIHIPVKTGADGASPRPELSPEDVAQRLREHLS